MTATTIPALRVDIISDVVCPWCIIGYSQLQAAADAVGQNLEVHWHPYELNPDMPPEGENLREHITRKYGASAEDSAKTRATITALGAEHGFKFDFKPESRIVNTLQAHKLIKWAAGADRQHELKVVLIRRYFTEGQDVSKEKVLLEAVKEVGLDVHEAQRVLDDNSLTRDIREEEHSWLAKGVQGVPSMVFQQRHLVTGAQGVETYKRILQQLSGIEAA